jgi:3-dehydroquinate dehydratase-2
MTVVWIALREGLLALPYPVIEVHVANVYKREALPHHFYLTDLVTGRIFGMGVKGHRLVLEGQVK